MDYKNDKYSSWIHKELKMLFIGVMLFLISCNHYYKTTLVQTSDQIEKAIVIDSLKHANRYFILRNGNSSYFMRNAGISNDKKAITSLLQNPGVDHRLHLMNGRNGKLKYNNKIPHDRHVLNEVHFSITSDSQIQGGPNRLQVSNINKIEIIEKDKKRTLQSTIIGVLAGLAGASALAVMFVMSLFR